MPPMLCCQVAALLIAGFFYMWRDFYRHRVKNEKVLRERVTYMLWVAAHR